MPNKGAVYAARNGGITHGELRFLGYKVLVCVTALRWLPRRVRVECGWLVAKFKIWESPRAVVPHIAHAVLVRGCPAECGNIGKEMTLIVSELTTARPVISRVLVRERNRVVAGRAGAEGKGTALLAELLWVHKQRVARIERSEGVNVASFFYCALVGSMRSV
jgi:hypothetical protein